LQFAQAFEDASRFSPKFKEYRPDMSKVWFEERGASHKEITRCPTQYQ
jgi:hypothetical protein